MKRLSQDLRTSLWILGLLVQRELKRQYKSTTLGVLWLLVNPLIQMLVLTTVFSYIVRIEVENYAPFVLAGLLPWMYFSQGVVSGTGSLISCRDLIKKVHFPLILIPLSTLGSQLVAFLIALSLLLLGFTLLFPFSTFIILILPAILLETILLVGLASLLSAYDIFYRDVSYMLQSSVFVLFYLTPVLYPISYIPDSFRFFYELNPLVGIIGLYQTALTGTVHTSVEAVSLSVFASSLIFIVGLLVFGKRSRYFADWV